MRFEIGEGMAISSLVELRPSCLHLTESSASSERQRRSFDDRVSLNRGALTAHLAYKRAPSPAISEQSELETTAERHRS